MEPRDDVDAATGPADTTTALQSAHTASIDLAHAVTTLATPVSSQLMYKLISLVTSTSTARLYYV